MKDEHRMRKVKEWGKGETDSVKPYCGTERDKERDRR